tara:strand:+ start:67 stop:732 length:666 start_codon:yes stop_codon:yes gene_type:complete
MRIAFLLIIGIICFAFDRESIRDAKKTALNYSLERQVFYADTLDSLLIRAASVDSLVYDNFEPFLFFKSGYLFEQNLKHALGISCPTDSTYKVEIYELKNETWKLNSSIDDIDAFPLQFELILKDFNFDKQTDLYIQETISNGYPLSRGSLIIVDPNTKRLHLHRDTKDLANMEPDSESKTVMSEEWVGYDNLSGELNIILVTNRWVNNKLVTVNKKKVSL